MSKEKRILAIVSLVVAIALMASALPVAAAPAINEEVTQAWVNNGNTKVHGVAAGDVDSDSTQEIVTVGEAYTGTKTQAQLRIWTWTGNPRTLSLEKTYEWSEGATATVTVAYDVFIGNLDASGGLEIAVAGATGDASGTVWMIRVFRWDGTTLTSYGGVSNVQGHAYRGVTAADLVGDSKLEILAAGDRSGSPHDGGVWIWRFDGTSLSYVDATFWGSSNDIVAYDVYAADVDADGTTEFVTVGYYRANTQSTKQGQMRIWNYASSTFTLEREDIRQEWQGQTTEWYSDFLGDVDNDGTTEIVVCGYGYNNNVGVAKNEGIVRIWTWTGTPRTFASEVDHFWLRIGATVCNSVYAKNLGTGSLLQIITGGKTDDSGTDSADLSIWNETSTPAFSSVAYTTWATGNRDTAINSVYASDVDGDGTVEILSGGQTYDGTYWNAQLRISNLSW